MNVGLALQTTKGQRTELSRSFHRMYTISKVRSSLSRFRTSKDLQSCPLTSRHCTIFGLPLPCRPSSWVASESTSHVYVYVRDTYTSTACVVYWLCTDFWGSKWKQVYQAAACYSCFCCPWLANVCQLCTNVFLSFFVAKQQGFFWYFCLVNYRHSSVFSTSTLRGVHALDPQWVDWRNHLITYIIQWKIFNEENETNFWNICDCTIDFCIWKNV